jgi:phosphoribosylformylglycinamidine synthase PurS subunit
MPTVRIIITLKPGVLDAQGQAVQQGLRALGYESVSGVRVGKCIDIIVPDLTARDDIDAMCEQFLANPLIEEWRVERDRDREENPRSRATPRAREASVGVPVFPRSRES